MDITSAFKGITTPTSELYDEIQQRGWVVRKVDLDKKTHTYKAEVKNPDGHVVTKVGRDPQTALAACLVHIVRLEHMRTAAWGTTFTDKQSEIAQAYAMAPVYEPGCVPAWMELADDSMSRAQALMQQINVEIVDMAEPYTNPQKMAEDIKNKQHLFVTRFDSRHPVWTEDQVIAFRIVHDIMGFATAGGDFGWTGQNLAFAAHAPLVSQLAQKALFTETVGKAAYTSAFRGIGPHKITFLDSYIEKVQKKENKPGHSSEPVDNTIAPIEMPRSSRAAQEMVVDEQTIPQQRTMGLTGVRRAQLDVLREVRDGHDRNYSRISGIRQDPNKDYDTGIVPPEPNGFVHYGDPLDYQSTRSNAQAIDSGWANFVNAEGQPDLQSMKQAIVNAFRVALLSPMKNVKWNAAHYQDISHIPHHVTDPKTYWDALSNAREDYNRSQGVSDADIQHKVFYKALIKFQAYYQGMHPTLSPTEAKAAVERELMNMYAEEESRLGRDSKDSDMESLEPKIDVAIKKRLEGIMRPSKVADTQSERDANPYMPPERYGAPMAQQLISISRVSQNSDLLLEAALEDVKNHDGAGHHFRHMVLALHIPHIGPKIASLAWLLLQPMTSQLATIDSHVMQALGHGHVDMSPRNYFKMERELQAGRDASGYTHMSLGQFQWAMGKAMGAHVGDMSPLAVWNPADWHSHDWKNNG